LIDKIYGDKLRYVFRKTGIEPYAKRLYWSISEIVATDIVSLCKHNGESQIIIYPDNTISPYPEQEIIEDVLSSVNDDDVFFDIGANFGRYCCIVSAQYDSMDVVAIEPNPSTVELLRNNINNNGVNVNAFEYALNDCKTTSSLCMPDNPERSRLDPSDEKDTSEGVLVDAIRGDEFINDQSVPNPSVIKIDVEGAELNVIKGMENTLKQKECRLLYCEVHPILMRQFDSTVEELYEILNELGFEIEVISRREVEHQDRSEPQKFIKARK
jgi:FkbM family methyltransferase